MTINIVIIVLLLVSVAYLLFKKLSKGVPKTIESFDLHINWLLDKGYSNYATLIIEVLGEPHFIQFQKYGSSSNKNDFGIQMDFPIVEWSAVYEEELVKLCQQGDLIWKEERGSDGLKFIVIDFEKNAKTAVEMAKKIVTTIFSRPDDQKYYYLLENCEGSSRNLKLGGHI